MIKYLTFLAVILGVYGDREICDHYGSGTYLYCDDGKYCCGDNHNPFAISAIVGIVIGGIIFLCFVVACICFCVQASNKPSRVIQPHPGANIAVVGFQSSPGSYPSQNGYNQYPPPPAYNQAGSQYPPPPAYNQSAAYNEPSNQPPAFGQATPGFSQTAYPPPPSFNSVPPNIHEK
ncbi:hypothetical protein MAR_009040 [Mya arenaria]|uniref:Cysteine and tyrosine-rich protein 1 n=1 Tax=Mya arenaria TaxID=6604 RepID=A0ABY7DXK5_MYAAR|nr:hypothetical protein MAR_009040 [Mya arenaria]